MKRRRFFAAAGVLCLGVAGCLDDADDEEGPGSDDAGSESSEEHSKSNEAGSDDSEPDDEGSNGDGEPDSSEDRTPTETVEAFADGFEDDDPEAVRGVIHPDVEGADEFDREVVESITFEIGELELTEEASGEASVGVVWVRREADGSEEEQELEVTLRSSENGWKIWELDSGGGVGEEARAAVDVDVVPDAKTATVTVTSIGNADGVYVGGDVGNSASCTEPMESPGDACEVEGEGTYEVVAYIEADSEADGTETVVHSFEIDG